MRLPLICAFIVLLGGCPDRSASSTQPESNSATPATTASPSTPAALSPSIDDERFTASLSTAPTNPGQKGALSLSIQSKPPWHINYSDNADERYNTSVRVTVPAGVTVESPVEIKKSPELFHFTKCNNGADNCSLKIELPFSGSQTGRFRAAAKIDFSVCDEKGGQCKLLKRELGTDILVN